MKKIFTLLAAVLISAAVAGQSPQKMSYQAVVRDAANHLVVNHPVGMQMSILQGSASGTEVYREVFLPNPQTNDNGLVTVEVGSGTPLSGTFATIDWSSGPYFLKTELDPSGGTSYTISGTSQLLSVPYAFHAGTVQTINEADPLFSASPASGISGGDTTRWNNAYSWGNHSTAGYISGNQPITLSGDITGTGTTSIATLLSGNSVTSAKIADNAVTTNKIAFYAVTESRIADNAISSTKLAIGSVTDTKIADNAVTANKIASNAVTTNKIPDGAVTLPKLNTTGIPSVTTYLRGDGQWISPTLLPMGGSNQMLYHNGSSWTASSAIMNNGTNLSIGTIPATNSQLYVYRQFGTNYGAGLSNLYAYRGGGSSAANGGTGWSEYTIDAAIKAYSQYGNNYTAGIAGYSDLDFDNSAAVIGVTGTNTYGALAFKDASSTIWSGYFTHHVYVGGLMKIAGGSPGLGKVLTSDASGNASWSVFPSSWTTNGTNIANSNSGNVGIGIINPTKKFHVEASQGGSAYSGNGLGTFINNISGSIDAAAVLGSTISTSDGFGIGGYFKGKYKAVLGEAYGGFYNSSAFGVHGYAEGSSGTRYGVYGSTSVTGGAIGYGVFCAGSGGYTGSWSNVSDGKFKKEIQPMDSSLALLMMLAPKTYKMKTGEYPVMHFNEGRQFGFIAQELQEVFPELVSKGAHPGETKEEVIEYLQVDYIMMIPVIVRALQEQQELIIKLQQQLDALK